MKKFLSLIFLFLLCSFAAWAQTRTISGTVTDIEDGSPLIGVTVVVKGTTKGTITDIDGKYTLEVDAKATEIVFSYIGMMEKKEIIGNRTVINVRMASDVRELDDVVVTALGIKREQKSLTVSQQNVNAATLAEVRDPNVVSSLAGKVSGVQVTPPSTATGSARIVIRGNSSFTGNNQPLWVVDGMPIDNGEGDKDNTNASGGGKLDMGNGAANLNPSDIESIEVLKGPNAAALYGSRATNGVILVTTKKATGEGGRPRVSFNSNNMFYYVSQWPDFQNVFGVGHMYEMVQGLEDRKYAYDPISGQYLPLMSEMMKDAQGSRSNGAPMMGQKYIGLDGKVHEYLPNPNNIKDFYQTAHILTNNLSVDGGTMDNSYRVSYTNTRSNDIVDNLNIVKKNTVSLRFFNTLYKKQENTFIKNITLDSKINYFNDLTKNRQYLNGDAKNPIFTYINMSRNMDLDELGRNGGYKDANGNEIGSKDFTNPYWAINENKNEDDRTRILASFDLNVQVMEELLLNMSYGKDYSNVRGWEFRNMGANRGDDKEGFYKDFHESFNNSMAKFLFLYNKSWSIFSVTATFGGERTENKGYNTWQQIRSLKIPDFMHISNSNEFPTAGKGSGWKRVNSLLGSATLGYKGWAFIDVTGRNDWSSTLPIENCSYFYPSIGGSWIITEMLNIPSSTFFGKIRGSWAQTGSDTDPYKLLLYYPLEGNNIYNSVKFMEIPDTKPKTDNDTGEPNLKPERTRSYEFGADVRFFNGRLSIDAAIYNKVSSDQIVRAATSTASGFAWSIKNAGSIENKGVELTVTGVPIKLRNKFDWEITTNFTKNKSIVLSMPDGLDRIELSRCWNSAVYIEEGMPYGVIRASGWAKDENGNRLVKENGSPLKVQNVYLGNANPDWMLGVSQRFRYFLPNNNGSADLYCLVDIKKGGGIFSGSRKQGIRSGVFFPEYTAGDALQERIDYWERRMIFDDPGDNLYGGSSFNNIYYVKTDADGNYMTKKDPVTHENILDSNGNPIYISSGEQCDKYFLPLDVGYYADDLDELVYYDASFIKLRELSIGYNLPSKWLRKIHLTSARVSAVGRNIWIIYQKTPKGLDPESASYSGNGQGIETGALPPTTTFGFDIKLTF